MLCVSSQYYNKDFVFGCLISVYYRMTVLFPTLVYTPEYGFRNSSPFNRLNADLMDAIDTLYEDVPGDQALTLVKVE